MSSPFDLEKAIDAWRRPFEHNRAFSSEDLEELESSLRDRVEAHVEAGMPEEAAFREAVRRLGSYRTAEVEYRKVYWGKLKRRRQLLNELSWSISMLKNYLKLAFRNLRRQKGYAFINIAGLSLGLACSFFIVLWVVDEVSYDRFHEHSDDLYLAMRHVTLGGQTYTYNSMPTPVADALEQEYPEVEHATLLTPLNESLLTHEDRTYREEGHYAGPAFFQDFSFPLLQGDPAGVLDSPDAIAISDRVARKFFGEDWRTMENVVGRVITVDHRNDFRVTGVFEDVPEHSTLRFDYVIAVDDFRERNTWVENWDQPGMQVYVKLRSGSSADDLNTHVADLINPHTGFGEATVFLKPLDEIHLYSDYKDGELQGGRIDLIRIFAVVAILLVLIASINFMNLATARSAQRAKEIGVRKATGASRGSLIRQFLSESMLMAGLAFLLAMALVLAILPVFNTITGKDIGVLDLNPQFLLVAVGIAFVTALISGSYPALHLASFNPTSILRATYRQGPGTARLRKGLVVFQFALSTLLIIGTAAVYLQIQYIMNRDLGLDRGNLVDVAREGALQEQYAAFKQELLTMPGIEQVSTSSQRPLSVGTAATAPTWEGKDPDDNTLFYIINAHYDFVETMRMELVAGRTFSEAFATDIANFVINERAAAAMGKANPVGEALELWGRKGQVIGVVKDFHMADLSAPIEPTIIRLDPPETSRWSGPSFVWVRLEEGQIRAGLESLETVYERFNPGYPLQMGFMDREFAEMHRGVIVMGKLANAFALVAILISCLGLFGLASFTTERRTKEIGVRKVLGASVSRLVLLLSGEFTKLVMIGFVLAAPLAYFAVNGFLHSFEYRVEIRAWMFVLAAILALLIAMLTVSYQTLRAALADPVKSLRYE